jgi:hypothetical protein
MELPNIPFGHGESNPVNVSRAQVNVHRAPRPSYSLILERGYEGGFLAVSQESDAQGACPTAYRTISRSRL